MRKVLLLDDDRNVLESYSRQLRNDFDLITAESGEKGLEVLRENEDISVVVSDLKMPGVSGLKFLQMSKDISPNSIRIMLTGDPDQQSIIEAVNSIGISSVLIKPCSNELLKKSIEDGLKKSNPTEKNSQLLLYKEKLKVESQRNKSRDQIYENEKKAMKSIYENKMAQENSKLINKIKDLERDLNSKSTHEDAAFKEKKVLKEKLKTIEDLLTQKNKIHDQLQLEKKQTEEKLQQMQAKLDDLNNQNKVADDKVADDKEISIKLKQYEDENRELRQENLALEKKYKGLENSSLDVKKIKSQIKKYKDQIENLRGELDKVLEDKKKLEKLKDENIELQEKLNEEIDYKNEIENLRGELDKVLEDKKKLEKLKDENIELQEKLSAESKEEKDTDKEFLKRNDELEQIIESNDKTFSALSMLLDKKLSLDNKIQKLDKIIEKHKLDIQELVDKNNSSESNENDSSGVLRFLMSKVDKKEELKEILVKQKQDGGEKDDQNILIQKKINKSHGAHGGSWKVAYADFVTAMMAFFLLMWLLSQLSQDSRDNLQEYFKSYKAFLHSGKEVAVADSVRHSKLIDKTKNIRQIEEFKKRFKGADEHLRVIDAPGGVRIQVMDIMDKPMFEIGSAILQPESKKIFEFISDRINEIPGKIIIEGHTDALKYVSNKKTNWELSMERASAARIELIKHGVDNNRLLRIVAYGSAEPLNADNALDPKNRRINIIVLDPNSDENLAEKP